MVKGDLIEVIDHSNEFRQRGNLTELVETVSTIIVDKKYPLLNQFRVKLKIYPNELKIYPNELICTKV